jgi:hypothetical protein
MFKKIGFKKIGISGAVVFAALGLMQTSAFAAERNGTRNEGNRNGYVQNDRSRQSEDQRGAYVRGEDQHGSYVRDRDDRRLYDRDDNGEFRDQGRWGDQFESRFGFDRDHDRR